jgi:tetratricopeptide (TPR) repeat protein
MSPRHLVAALLVAAACRRPQGESTSAGPAEGSRRPSVAEQGRALLAEGRLDEAVAKLEEAPNDPDALAAEGSVWAKKAETAPLPTPPAPERAGAPARAPVFKPEELKALGLFEKAVALRPDHPQGNLGIAELLTPFAARRYDLEESGRGRKPVRRGKGPEPSSAPEDGPDASADRVIRAYQLALQGDSVSKAPAEGLVEFCVRVNRLDEAEGGLRELVRRDKEKPDPHIRYGDFLVSARKDPHGALEQYRQALIWRGDDDQTRSKIADIYINMGIESYSKLQYAAAESRFTEAQKYVSDTKSPQGLRIQDYMGKLAAIRKLPPH